MKRTVMLVCCLLAVTLCACGRGNAPSADPTTASTAATSAATSGFSEQEAVKTANDLFDALDLIDRLGGAAVDTDAETSVVYQNAIYHLVTDPRFPDIASIRSLIDDTLTKELASERYGGLTDLYLEQDGKLYVKEYGKGCGFPFDGDAAVKDMSADKFVAERRFDNYGAAALLQITAVQSDGRWKIGGMTVS